jgi:hypothetical protein
MKDRQAFGGFPGGNNDHVGIETLFLQAENGSILVVRRNVGIGYDGAPPSQTKLGTLTPQAIQQAIAYQYAIAARPQ